MNIIERIITQEVKRFIKVNSETVPFFKVIDSHVKNYLFDPDRKILILLVDKEKYDSNPGKYVAIKKFMEVYPPFVKFMSDLGINNYTVMYAFPYTEKNYYHLSKANVTPFSRILVKEEAMKLMLSSVDAKRRDLESFNESLQPLLKADANKRKQLQFLLEVILSNKPEPSNKAIIDDYDIYKFIMNIYYYLYGKIPEKRDIQALIDDDTAELFKAILDRHYLINWAGVEGKTTKEKVINVLLELGFGKILEIIATVNFIKPAQGSKKSSKKKKKSSSVKKRQKKIKTEAKQSIELSENTESTENMESPVEELQNDEEVNEEIPDIIITEEVDEDLDRPSNRIPIE